MFNDITYNQIIFYKNTSFNHQNIKKSFVEHNKLILILEDSQKIIISGKNIHTTGYKKRIKELLLMAKGDGIEIQEKSVMHYAIVNEDEYILIRW